MEKETSFSPELAIDVMPEKHREKWEEDKANLIKRAIGGCARIAENYRDFFVGCSILSYNEGVDDYYLDQTGNFRLSPAKVEGRDKRCAERWALEHAELNHDSAIVGMVVTSFQTQPDIEQGVKSDVLYPCKDCREMFAQSPLIKLWTKILLIKLREDVGKMDRDEFYENLSKIDNPKKIGEIIEAMKEMSYAEFIKKLSEGNI